MFKILIRVGVIIVLGSLWLCKNDKVINDKNVFSYAGNLPMYYFAAFMVVTSAYGGSIPLYECVHS
jgi:hypothetical protein